MTASQAITLGIICLCTIALVVVLRWKARPPGDGDPEE